MTFNWILRRKIETFQGKALVILVGVDIVVGQSGDLKLILVQWEAGRAIRDGVRPGFGPVQVLSVSEFMVCRSSGLNIGPGVVPMGETDRLGG